MESIFRALGQFVVRFKYPVAIAWIVITIFSVKAFPSLGSVTKDTNSGFLPDNTPSIQASHLADAFQNSKLISADLLAVRNDGPLTVADQAVVDRLSRIVKAMPNVKGVRDEGTSRDGAARTVLILADASFNGSGTGKTLVDNIRKEFTTVGAPAGLNLHLYGELPTAVDNRADANKSQNRTQSLSILFIIVLLLIAFRALLAPLVTLLPAALVLALSSPVIAASTRLGVQASSITQIILIVLVLGAGTDYGLFLVFRVREELRRGLAPHDAVVRALTQVGETITFSAFTVIAALLSLLLAQFGLYQGLGPALAIGIGLMLLAGLTLLPAILAIFGRAVFWPSNVSRIENQHVGLWGRVGAFSSQRPRLTLIAGVALFIALALGQLGIGITGFADQTSGPSGSDSAAGATAAASHFPGSSTNPTDILFHLTTPIWTHPATLDAAQQKLSTTAAFRYVTGPLTPNGFTLSSARLAQLHSQLGVAQDLPRIPPANLEVSPAEYNAYRATSQFISRDGLTVQWSTVLRDNRLASSHDIDEIPALRDTVNGIGQSIGASKTGVFGLLAFAYDVNNISTNDLMRIIPFVAIVIAILLAIVLRSLVAPLYLVASVVLSYLAALGFAAIVFVHLGGGSGLNFVLPFLVFVFLTALGSDYNILLMTRIREESHKLPLRQAVPVAVGVSGSTITTAGVILAGTFAVLAVGAGNSAGSDQVRQIGYGIAAGVLMDTFLIRTLLVPAIVAILGRWNWWPSRLSRQQGDVLEAGRTTGRDEEKAS